MTEARTLKIKTTLARQMAQPGGRTLADVEAVAGEIRALGRRALAVACDVNDPAQLAAAVSAFESSSP